MSKKYLIESGTARSVGDRPSASKTFRNTEFKDSFPPLDSISTLHDLFQTSVSKYGEQPCLGWRRIDQETGQAEEYQWLTYNETNAKVQAIAAGLAGLGLLKNSPVGIYGSNCCEWMITMQACARMSYQCVPLYDTLGENAVEFVINHSEAQVAVADSKKLGELAKAVKGVDISRFKNVVYWGKGDAAAVEALTAAGVDVTSLEDLIKAGQNKPVDAVPPSPDGYSTIMYTSGTTGDPKGVLLKHSAVVATVSTLVNFIKTFTEVKDSFTVGDRFLSYLPLAHVFDLVSEEMFLAGGGAIGYWQGSPATLVDDMAELKPTLLIGVPRVYDRIYGRIKSQIDAAGGVKKALFNWGYARKLHYIKQGLPQAKASPFFDRLVFNKIKQRLGGHVKIIVSGGAPLARHVEEFLKVTMCAPVVQGYGLTETCAASCIAVPDVWSMHGSNGPCTPCTELRLESVPEMDYDALSDTQPAGEVLLRGPQLFSGYYKQPDKTAEVLDDEGWLHTGDIGMISATGGLKIVDRKKNMFKLSQGEYVAVEKLEALYKKTPSVEQIWVYGNSFKSSLVAVVVPEKHAITDWAKNKGKTGTFAELCKDAEAEAWMLSELRATGKANKMKGFEAVKGLILEPEQFSVENDCMTPTFKFKRPQLQKRYQAAIDALYDKLESADRKVEHMRHLKEQEARRSRSNSPRRGGPERKAEVGTSRFSDSTAAAVQT